MKLTVIGLGQCGSRIADHFAKLNSRARAQHKATIAPIVIAANTDQADLTGLRFVKNDYRHRILMGLRRTLGHGVGKINELGAQLAKEDGDKILDAVKASPHFYQTHAFLLIAGAAGGTGSGALPVMARAVKDRSTYNSATCLKSTYDIVDAVFLADNQRYVRKDATLASNIDRINRMIAEPFYDLMCAGEVTRAKYVGSRTVDGGDIIASLEGWTTIGLGRTELPSFRFPWEIRKKGFREKALESFRGTQALDATISDLSLTCDPKDAGKAIYIISGPEKELNMDMVKSVSDYIKELAPNALIRGGDFPGEKHFIDVTLILSQLAFVPRIKDFYEQATQYYQEHKGQLEQTKKRVESLAELGKDLPTLG
jgi:cell division GTPase FtsZ